MNDFEEMKKFAKWKAWKKGKWSLFGLYVVGLILGFVGMTVVVDAAPPINSLSWIVQVGIVVAMAGWIIGGIIGSIFLAVWASED